MPIDNTAAALPLSSPKTLFARFNIEPGEEDDEEDVVDGGDFLLLFFSFFFVLIIAAFCFDTDTGRFVFFRACGDEEEREEEEALEEHEKYF